ncbi:MAG: HD domain-containing phosphohydrolase [Nitrospinota bacterium]
MSTINLKRLLSKKKLIPLIKNIASLYKEGVTIRASDGTLIFEAGEGARPVEYPLTLGDETLGVVCGGEKTAEIIDLLNYIISSEYEKKTLAKETLDKYKEITLLSDLGERITACLNKRQVAELIIEEIRKAIKFDGISVMYLNRDTGMLQILASSNQAYFSIALGAGIAGSVASKGKGEIVNDVSSDPRFIPGPNPMSSIMCVPLKINDRVIGVINVHSVLPHVYSAKSLKLLATIAAPAAIAIENARLYEDMRETFLATIQTLAATIEKRDTYTTGHTERVSDYSLAIGKSIGLTDSQLDKLKLASILHDIGKIGVKDTILLKKGKLTDEEFAEMKKHAEYGHEILSPIAQLKEILDGVKFHHERYDGKGYPDGLKGDEISMEARIIAIADSYDAMTSDRPYRKGLTTEKAKEELARCSGTQFDPEIVEIFLKNSAHKGRQG